MRWLAALLLLLTGAKAANAQNSTNVAPVAEKFAITPGNVDIRTGRYVHDEVDLSIGDTSEVGGLALKRSVTAAVPGHINPFANFTHNWDITLFERPINVQQGNYTGQTGGPDVRMEISFGGRASTFQANSNDNYYAQVSHDSWATLTFTGSGIRGGANAINTYTANDGTVVTFRPLSGYDCSSNGWRCAFPSQITYADGTILTFEYETQSGAANAARLRSVTSNHGYALLFEYGASGAGWNHVAKSCVINLAVTTKPATNVCPGGVSTMTYGYGSPAGVVKLTIATNDRSESWTYTYTGLGSTPAATYNMGFVKPGQSNPWMTNSVSVGINHRLGEEEVTSGQSFSDGSSFVYTYDYSPAVSGEISAIAGGSYVNALNEQTQVRYDFPLLPTAPHPGPQAPRTVSENGDVIGDAYQITPGPALIVDPLGRETKLDNCDPNALAGLPSYEHNRCIVEKLRSITDPEGNKTYYSYEFSMITQVRKVAKPGPDPAPADIIVSATYNCTPTTIKFCAKPVTSTDARGAVTDFTYSTDHGGVLTETRPAATSGGTRPQKRYSYGQFYAWYKDASGTLVQAATPIWLPTAISECSTGTAPICVGTANETRTTFTYGASGTANNLLLISKTVAAGDGSLSATTSWTYDAQGNKLTEDGPLPGGGDTTRWRYDSLRRVIGVVSPDPDGSVTTLKPRATRNTYDPAGRLTKVEIGTVDDQTDTAWAAFTPLQTTETSYDALDRKTREWAYGTTGGTQTVTQYSYDLAGRLKCTAVRMDPAQWTGQTDACVPQTSGPNGPDRITKLTYDAAGQLTKTTVALGTDVVADDTVNTWTPNGKLETLTDGEGNKTTYEYDRHDRQVKTRYPSPTTPGTSSTTDYAGATYDANGNVTQARLRDGTFVNYTFDALNRRSLADFASEADISYSYDLFGRSLQAIDAAGHQSSYGYDALGRIVSQTGTYGGAKTMDYDPAGRRTRMAWADGFYVNYDRLVTGEVSAIRANGATSGLGLLGQYTYDVQGRRVELLRGNGVKTTWGYDPIGRLMSLSHDAAGTSSDVGWSYSYNPAGQIIASTRDNDAYAYTALANQDIAETPNGLNQLVTQGAAATTYDAKGNLIAGPSFPGTAYSQRNLPLTGPGSGSTPGQLWYDPEGRLDYVGPNAWSANDTLFDYDGPNLTSERSLAGGGGMLRRYVHGPGTDEVLIWYEGSDTSDPRWLLQDALGSTIGIAAWNGSVTQKLAYDDYGAPATGNIGRFQYTGQTWMPELGVYNYKARLYHPGIGRFLQTDPTGYDDGTNLYAYVNGDPIDRRDPSGKAVAAAPLAATPLLEACLGPQAAACGVIVAGAAATLCTLSAPCREAASEATKTVIDKLTAPPDVTIGPRIVPDHDSQQVRPRGPTTDEGRRSGPGPYHCSNPTCDAPHSGTSGTTECPDCDTKRKNGGPLPGPRPRKLPPPPNPSPAPPPKPKRITFG